MARDASFDLAAASARPEFTPGRRDVPAIVELLVSGDEAVAEHAGRALTKVPPSHAVTALTEVLPNEGETGAVRVLYALGLIARSGGTAAVAPLIAALGNDELQPRARREAAIALGKLGATASDDVRAAVLARWNDETLPADHRRALTDALGKLGGDAAREALAELDVGDNAELARLRSRGLLMTTRDAQRQLGTESIVDIDAAVTQAAVARCRTGLEPLVIEELTAAGLRASLRAPGVIDVALAGSLRGALSARTLLTLGLRVDLMPGEFATTVADALGRPTTIALLRSLTRGPIRWRLDFSGRGHQRKLVWNVAERVRQLAPELINDPQATTWDVVVTTDGDRPALELRPRRFVDDRYPWRKRDVPAASHPSIAAALAMVADAQDDDVVWDPFVGSGSELIERARRGPARRILGTDIDPRALEAARENIAAAGFADRIELALGDARTSAPPDLSLVISNPPLGRRLRGDVGGLLEEFLEQALPALRVGGRLVWIAPVPARTGPLLMERGFRHQRSLDVDLGGFVAPMQRWQKLR